LFRPKNTLEGIFEGKATLLGMYSVVSEESPANILPGRELRPLFVMLNICSPVKPENKELGRLATARLPSK
jgi:hypothetical protein